MIFSADEIKSIEEYQQSPNWHPLTCGYGHGILTPTPFGVFCHECGYTQSDVLDFIKNWDWKKVIYPRNDK